MGLYRKTTSVSKIYRGNTEINKAYRGQTEIWSAIPPTSYYVFGSSAGGLLSNWTGNFTSGQFSYSPPSGYSAIDGAYDPSNSITSATAAGSGTIAFSNSNRTVTKSGSGYYQIAYSANGPSSGKIYHELVFHSADVAFGFSPSRIAPFQTDWNAVAVRYYSWTGGIVVGTTGNSYSGTSWASSGTVVAVAIDIDNSQFTFYRNNSSQGTYSF